MPQLPFGYIYCLLGFLAKGVKKQTEISCNMRIVAIITAIVLLTTACHTSFKNQGKTLQQVPETLIGSFKDDYGSEYQISNTEWRQGNGIKYHLLLYNKSDKYFIAKNDSANPSDGNLYNRIDIMYFENMEPWRWGYCLTVYKATSVEEAINTAAADRLNPRKGCNGYPFSRMKRE